ncbi:imidazole glycerol phosphate synthase subunit HisF [bacterium]|nr:imidazole glycerol phosphate synthase subunit HisF [bacterium]
MVTKRLIPCLDVHAGRVVKGTHFVDLRDAGDPVELADRYNQLGADELVLLDIGATHESRGITLQLIESVAKRVFIPFTVGGGIQSIDTIATLLDHGADKVSLNSVAVKNPSLVESASRQFGAQCVVVAIDAQPVRLDAARPSGVEASIALDDQSAYEVVINGGRIRTGIDVLKWAQRMVSCGAGELLVTAMHCDGVKQGYDLSLMRALSRLSVPIIASGGAGHASHVVEVLQVSDAALLASVLHFGTLTLSELRHSCHTAGLPMRRVGTA